MKPFLKIAVIFIALMLAAGCQKAPETPVTSVAPGEEASTETTAVEGTSGEGGEESPIVSFYEPAGTDENAPTYLLFITPWDKEYPAQVNTTCNGVEAYVVAGTNGIRIHNHCILETNSGEGYAVLPDGSTATVSAYAVLPDGTTIFIAPETKLQINLGEGTSEVILESGEILNNVAPQLTDRSFSVLAGDLAFDAVGTQYAVSVRGKQVSVGVIDGRVVSKRCLQRTTRACTNWHPNLVTLSAGEKLSSEIGGTEPSTPEAVDFYNGEHSDFPIISPALLNGIWYFGVSINGEHFDEINFVDSVSFITVQIELELILLEKEINFYNELLADQYKLMAYCNAAPENCPPAEKKPTETAEPQDPGTTGGGCSPSGKFPPMDQSSCFNNAGALFCYPVAGSTSLAGEWNISEICKAYPCESFCGWLP